MAASNKPTPVHFSLIFFVMTSIVAVVFAVMYRRDYQATDAELTKLKSDLNTANASAKNLDDEVQALKARIGFNFEDVGLNAEGDPNTVLGAMSKAMRDLVGNLEEPNFYAALVKLRGDLNSMTEARDTLDARLQKTQQDLLAVQDAADGRVGEAEKVRTNAEQTLQASINTNKEQLDSLNRQLDVVTANLNQTQDELAREKDARAAEVREKNSEIDNLTLTNTTLREKIDEQQQVSFEVPDGQIMSVNSASGIVIINLGSSDDLRVGTTFSVYEKGGRDVGRGPEHIKGAIEITQINRPHMATARVIDEDLFRPMSKGDPVYTPLWSPGRAEQFAFAGVIDLDGDGKSDRALLHEIVESTGATIVTELDEEGNRLGSSIDVDTKFLVLGHVPEERETGEPGEADRMARIRDNVTTMRREATQHGVRVLTLSDFLSFIGYHSRRRLYQPGSGRPYELQSGRPGSAVNNAPIDESGNVSGAFGRSGRTLPPKTTEN